MRLDLGCGPNRKPSFLGVDVIPFEGVDLIYDLRARWPWEDGSVQEAHSSHFVEHLKPKERIHFANELHRVLVPKGTATIITPHWCSQRAYGDLTHEWPPVSEFWFLYLGKEWRMSQAPHTDAEHMPGGYTCDFDATWVGEMNHEFPVRNNMAQDFARLWYKEAVTDLRAILYKR